MEIERYVSEPNVIMLSSLVWEYRQAGNVATISNLEMSRELLTGQNPADPIAFQFYSRCHCRA